MLVLVGCATDPAPEPVDRIETEPLEVIETDLSADVRAPDYCALAAALPADDICSLVCDPVAMAAQLEADGNDRGRCYQLRCQLTDEHHVLAGVCLPP